MNSGLESLTREKLDNIISLLRTSTGDPRLQIIKLEAGSIKITFQTTVDDYEKIANDLQALIGTELVKFNKLNGYDITIPTGKRRPHLQPARLLGNHQQQATELRAAHPLHA